MSEIFCNTSPLQYLHQLDLLSLLRQLAGRIVIPPGVEAELDAGRRLGIDVPGVAGLDWIEIRPPESIHSALLVHDLGPGETEVLLLALEFPQSVVILDDALARRVAEFMKVRFTGTLGILLDAKRAGLLPEVRPMVDRLQALGFRLSKGARRAILELAGESVA